MSSNSGGSNIAGKMSERIMVSLGQRATSAMGNALVGGMIVDRGAISK